MDNFKIVKRISDGAFGTVYEATTIQNNTANKYPSTVAIKQMYSSSQNLQRQLKILKKLPKNQHIIEVYTTFTSKFETNIVMEKGKYDLSNWIQKAIYPISQNTIKNIAYQLLQGIILTHTNNIIHRDLKPSNLVIRENGKLAICDFGSAIECSKGEEYQIQGFTRWYKCPEMLYGCRKYLFQADMWSAGCILMEVATGTPLFAGKSQIEQLSLIAKFLGDPSIQNWPSVAKMPDYKKINFNKMPPKTIQEISREWGVSLPFAKFITKMVRYQNRVPAKVLLQDEYFKGMTKLQSIDLINPIINIQKQLIEKAKKQKIL